MQAYQDIRHQLENEAGRINGKYGQLGWTPLYYLNQHFDRKLLMKIFRYSDVGLVTPLRDGMNLVAKEYVAAQDPANPGVLVLSQFAGAANELTSALIVNPYVVTKLQLRWSCIDYVAGGTYFPSCRNAGRYREKRY